MGLVPRENKYNYKVVHMSSTHNATFIRLLYKMAISTAKGGYSTYIVAIHPNIDFINDVNIVGVKRLNGFFGKIINSFVVYFKAIKLKPDLCHIHTPLLYPFIPLLKLHNIEVVVDMYENQIFSFELYNIYPNVLKRIFAFIYRISEKFFLQNVYVIFAEDSYHYDYFWIKHYCVILNMPILSTLNDVVINKNRLPTIGYIGGLSKERGILNLIQSIEILKRKNLIVNLELIGTGSTAFLRECKDLVEKFELQRQIIFYGFLEPVDAYQIAGRWWAGLALLFPRKNYINSYPTKIFEYMALQMPIIVSDFPLYEKVITDNQCGFAVDPLNLFQISECIETICIDHNLRHRFSVNGFKAVNAKYSWNLEEKKLLVFYNNILHKRKL